MSLLARMPGVQVLCPRDKTTPRGSTSACTRSSSVGQPSLPRGSTISDPGCTGWFRLSNINLLNPTLTSKQSEIFKYQSIMIIQRLLTTQWSEQPPNPNQMRWKPFDIPDKDKVDWVDGLRTVAGQVEIDCQMFF